MGTDALFENHSIKEIQEIEKKLRNDIEQKKEELRQMVGERYRDLMEAADTITEMKEIAESVTQCVGSIEKSCSEMRVNSLQSGLLQSMQSEASRKKNRNQLLYKVSALIKILMDSPVKMWSYIERGAFLDAVSLFLLCRHVHARLCLDPVYQAACVPVLFPVVERQWTSVAHFRHILLQNCQNILRTQDAEPENVLGPLCCNCLLTNTSVHHIFLEVLETRMNVLESVFQPEKTAKVQLCEFVTVVQMTLKMVHYLFYPSDPTGSEKKTNKLQYTLKALTNKEPDPVDLLDTKSSATSKYLLNEVADFRPTLNASLDSCSEELLQTRVTEWLNNIKSKFESELKSLLDFVTSVRSLSLILEALCAKLCEVPDWENICVDLLKQPFSLWDSYLKECFWQRIKDIIHEQVKSCSEYCQKDIEQALGSIGLDTKNSPLETEGDVATYVWAEHPPDVGEEAAWLARHHRPLWGSGGLAMKALGLNPSLQRLCREVEEGLEGVLRDASHFPPARDRRRAEAEQPSRDAQRTYAFLAEATEKHFYDLSSFLETTLLYLEREKDSYENNCRTVFLGHLCYAIAVACPQINICLSPEKLNECVERCLRLGSSISSFSAAVFKDSELWKDLKKKLLHLSATAFRLWSQYEIQQILASVRPLLVTSSAEDMLKTFLQWDSIEIQEETEQGNAVKSVLRVPQYVSTPVSNALFVFCCKLNAVGGFSINSRVRSGISSLLLSGLLAHLRDKLHLVGEDGALGPKLLQAQCLQVMFDVHFLTGLLLGKGSGDLGLASRQILAEAAAHVDPFDLDVFSAPLQQNVRRALHKSLSLFGLLASQEQQSSVPSLEGGDPSPLLCCPPGSRFPLLPLPSRTEPREDTCSHTVLQDPAAKCLSPGHSSSPDLVGAATEGVGGPALKSAASFYDRVTNAMSSSWFGGN